MKHLPTGPDCELDFLYSLTLFLNSDLFFSFSRQKSTHTKINNNARIKLSCTVLTNVGCESAGLGVLGYLGHCFTEQQGPHCRLITQGARSVVRYLL